MNEAVRRLWVERTERERATIWIASALLVLGLTYTYLWLPVTRERDRLLVRVPELRVEAQAMERDARESERLKNSMRNKVDLRSAVEKAVAAVDIPAQAGQIMPQGAGQVRVVIPATRQELAFRWLAGLQATQGVRLESLRFTAVGDGDRVKVEAMLGEAR